MAGRSRHEAVAGESAGVEGCQGHSHDVLVVPSRRQTRLQHAVHHIGAAAEEATRAITVASDSAVAVSRIGFLEEGVRWNVGEYNDIHGRMGHLRAFFVSFVMRFHFSETRLTSANQFRKVTFGVGRIAGHDELS